MRLFFEIVDSFHVSRRVLYARTVLLRLYFSVSHFLVYNRVVSRSIYFVVAGIIVVCNILLVHWDEIASVFVNLTYCHRVRYTLTPVLSFIFFFFFESKLPVKY